MSAVAPEAREAGLAPRDLLTGIDGMPIPGVVHLYARLRAAVPGDRLNLQARTDERPVTREVSIELRALRTGPPTVAEWLNFIVVNLATPYLCMALGFWVVFVRIRDRQAWLLLLVALSLAVVGEANPRTLYGRADAFQRVAAAYQPLFASLWPVAMMLFGIYFPERLELDRRHPWAKWMVVGPILVLSAMAIVITQLMLHNAARAVDLERFVDPVSGPVSALNLAAMVLFLVCMVYKIATATQADSRRRLVLLAVGGAASMAPLIFLYLAQLSGLTQVPDWFISLFLLPLFIFPATMAYVIVVHRAMDVRVVIRQGLQYLLARGGVRAVQVVLSSLILTAAMITASASIETWRRAAFVAAGFIAVFSIRRFADTLRRWVDRRFFREAYNVEQILGDLADKVLTMVETGPLLETVARQISSSLHVPRVAILLNEDGALRPAYAVGYPTLPGVVLPEYGRVAQQLRKEPHARVLTGAPDAWLEQAGESEHESLEQLDAELLLPLSFNQRLAGVISLGPKQSEEPFSSGDIRLLRSVATQTGLALQNSRLTAEIAAEISNREKRNRELEIAREVQQRLFPQDYPPVPGLEYAGACRPAFEVGGDYYDFIKLSEREFGIAVGDVSGKGIPASLLMATLRAYLRGQTAGRESHLPSLMANLNTLVYESSTANRYATFFYAQHDAATRALVYVNGGHNPPLLFKAAADNGEPTRLDVGGLVIGLMPECGYVQGQVVLGPGDLLVAFTDGISEAMNAADEEWGERRLIEAIRCHRALPPGALIERIMASADAFVAGAPQHDDMTVVVVRAL